MAEQAGLGFGGLLRQLRDDAGLTQEQLAEAARVSKRAVSDLERGINRTARKDTAVLLAGALGLDERARELFVSAARGRASTDDVLAALDGRSPGAFAAAARVRPNNLPAQVASFIGRDQELADAGALARSSRLVTLTGAGGAARPGWPCSWPPGYSTGPVMGSGWWNWLRSPARTRWRRPSAERWGSPLSRVGRPWTHCWMRWPPRPS